MIVVIFITVEKIEAWRREVAFQGLLVWGARLPIPNLAGPMVVPEVHVVVPEAQLAGWEAPG